MKFLKTVVLFTILVWFTSCDESGESLFVFPSTPYLGISRTLEADPLPIGESDPTDWLPIPEAGIVLSRAYPNPSSGQVTLRFAVSYEQKGLIYIHHPITNQIEILVDNEFLPGLYQLSINFREAKFQKGIIRAYFNFGGHISWGDIFYN